MNTSSDIPIEIAAMLGDDEEVIYSGEWSSIGYFMTWVKKSVSLLGLVFVGCLVYWH